MGRNKSWLRPKSGLIGSIHINKKNIQSSIDDDTNMDDDEEVDTTTTLLESYDGRANTVEDLTHQGKKRKKSTDSDADRSSVKLIADLTESFCIRSNIISTGGNLFS